ncbi:MAG: CHASE2 domain-containing protein, partial [Cyanobacteria bacterium J06649_11]
MKKKIWNCVHKESKLWFRAAPPGIVILVVIVLIRMAGGMQSLEWAFLDNMLRLRPLETVDERVVIVGINEKDIESVQKYPISDEKIAELLTKLESYKPRAIGLDLFVNTPVEPGSKKLARVLKNNNNIVGIEKFLPPGQIAPNN